MKSLQAVSSKIPWVPEAFHMRFLISVISDFREVFEASGLERCSFDDAKPMTGQVKLVLVRFGTRELIGL